MVLCKRELLRNYNDEAVPPGVGYGVSMETAPDRCRGGKGSIRHPSDLMHVASFSLHVPLDQTGWHQMCSLEPCLSYLKTYFGEPSILIHVQNHPRRVLGWGTDKYLLPNSRSLPTVFVRMG